MTAGCKGGSVALVAVLLLSGCGSDDDTAEPATQGSAPATTSTTTSTSEAPERTETMAASDLSQEGNVLIIDDQGFYPIVVNDDSCDTGGCSATFDVVNEGTTTHTFTIDDHYFPPDWLNEYGPIDREIAPGETAGGRYVSFLPGDAQELNPDTLEFYCRLHPSLRGQFVEGD